MIFWSVQMWSMHPTPGLQPSLSFRKMVSMAPLTLIWMILQKILLGTERSITPRLFVHCVLSPFLGSLTISPLQRSSSMVSAFCILGNGSYHQYVTTRMSGRNDNEDFNPGTQSYLLYSAIPQSMMLRKRQRTYSTNSCKKH